MTTTFPLPTAFRVFVTQVQSLGVVEYIDEEHDRCDNYEDKVDDNLATLNIVGDLDTVFTKLATVLADVAPGHAPFHYNGEYVSTSPTPQATDRIDILLVPGDAEADLSCWVFGLDVDRAEIARLTALLG